MVGQDADDLGRGRLDSREALSRLAFVFLVATFVFQVLALELQATLLVFRELPHERGLVLDEGRHRLLKAIGAVRGRTFGGQCRSPVDRGGWWVERMSRGDRI